MFEILITDRAVKDLQSLRPELKVKIGIKLKEYSENPLKHAKKLIHQKAGTYRFWIGEYRVVFDLKDNKIIILRVGHRKEIYR